MNRDILKTSLINHEAVKLLLYDDATGKPLRRGDTIIGTPTIGIGRNLIDVGITGKEADFLVDTDIDRAQLMARNSLDYFTDLNDARQNVIVELVFNMGIGKVLVFYHMNDALRAKDYDLAAKELHASNWFKEVGRARGDRLCKILELGYDLPWPKDGRRSGNKKVS